MNMGHPSLRRLGSACLAAVALVCLCAASAGAQLLPQAPELPDVNDVPAVKGLADTVENATGLDLPNLGSNNADPPAQPPAAQPSPPPSNPEPAPGPGPSVGDTNPAPTATAPASSPDSASNGGGSSQPAGAGGGDTGADPGSAADGGAGAAGGSRADTDSAANDGGDGDGGGGGGDDGVRPIGEFITDFESLPVTLLIAIVVLALLGLVMAGRSASLARLARRLHIQRGELREDVGALQSALLPHLPEKIGEVALSVAYRPEAGPAAGGDFHDVVALDGDRIGIVVGDVSGHGREALTITALAHYTVRAYLEAGLEPRAALRLADEALGGKLGSDFVTVLAAIYDPAESSLVYATAGHPAPILIGAGADSPVHVLTPPPIGVGPRTGFRQTTIAIGAGAQICFFTDGLVEARLAPGSMVEREGLVAMLGELGDAIEAPRLLDRVTEAATVADDMTACVIRPLTAAGDGTVVEELDLGGSPTVCDRLEPFLEAFGMAPEEREIAIAECRRCAGASERARLLVERRGSRVAWRLEEADTESHRLSDTGAPAGAGSPPPAAAKARA
jgi:hypothetical protein